MNGRKNACKSKNLFVIYIILSTMENVNVEVVFTLQTRHFLCLYTGRIGAFLRKQKAGRDYRPMQKNVIMDVAGVLKNKQVVGSVM